MHLRVVDAMTCDVQGSGMTMLVNVSNRPLLPILLALSGAHLLNDLISSMIPAMYPLLKEAYQLDFTQVGLITLAFQVTSSLLQPLLGFAADHKPWLYAMVAGMAATLTGWSGLRARATTQWCSFRQPWSGSGRPCSIQKPREWRAMRRPASRALHRVFFKSAGMLDMRLGRCWPR
jgi:hypothetical protein